MRIIGGLFKGRKLKAVAGSEVRPTSDRLRETLFNILAPVVSDSHFLDLCAGSGAVGIEAFSRGASRVGFVDQSRRSCLTIKENLATLGIQNQAQILQRDALQAIKQLEATASLDSKYTIVFFDPPYASEIYERLLPQLATSPILHEDALVVVEHRTKHKLAEAYGCLKRYREVKQGESALTFYALQSGE
jgi:16S rRNA (guanine966-N2)-methyltransferase